MTNTLTLDDIRREAERRYAPVEIELTDGSTVELKPLLKLKKLEREEVSKILTELGDLEADEDEVDDEEIGDLICDAVAKIFRMVCDKPKRLLAELDHEDPEIKASMYTSVLNQWIGVTQVGEAVSSPN